MARGIYQGYFTLQEFNNYLHCGLGAISYSYYLIRFIYSSKFSFASIADFVNRQLIKTRKKKKKPEATVDS